MGARRGTRRRVKGTGRVRQLPSGRWQARYPDSETGRLITAPITYAERYQAEQYLAERVDEEPEQSRPDPLLRDYAAGWLEGRDLKPRTREHYRVMLEGLIEPDLGSLRLSRITPTRVRSWHDGLDKDAPTMRAHAYGLLRTILGTAHREDLIDANPCRISGAGSAKTRVQPKPATLDELEQLVAAMPDKYRAMTLLAAWCGLRFGELTELRRSDVDIEAGLLRIARGVVRVKEVDGDGQARTVFVVGDPKSDAGRRRVAIPPHIIPALREHLEARVSLDPGALLFPAVDGVTHLAPSTLYRSFYPARVKAGRPDLRWHDLRHTGLTMAAQAGATLAELMNRAGHSTVSAAIRYQHAASEQDQVIAARLSEMATSAATVTPTSKPTKSRRRSSTGN